MELLRLSQQAEASQARRSQLDGELSEVGALLDDLRERRNLGEARFEDPHTLRILRSNGSESLRAEHVIIATGTTPARPANVPFDGEHIVDSDSVLRLPRLPRSMIIVGGGVIGTEYACMMAALGVRVILTEARDRLLDFVDGEIIESLQYQMRSIGVTFRFNEEVVGVEKSPDNSVAIFLKSGKKIGAPLLMYCVGRIGATQTLGLENVGIEPDDRGRIKVNGNFQTGVPHIYAVGDVVGFPALASTSMQQGRHAAPGRGVERRQRGIAAEADDELWLDAGDDGRGLAHAAPDRQEGF